MRVFILYDDDDRAYPILGVYTTLAKALEDGKECPPGTLCVYEEETDLIYDDPKQPPFEPIHHEVNGGCPHTRRGQA